MIISDTLTAQLGALTAVLDEPGTDLETILDVLVDDLTAAVPSSLGLRMTLQMNGCPVTLTAVGADLALTTGASLSLPLSRSTDEGPGGRAVFYARHPGAFVDLAADLQRVDDLDGEVDLDGHLPSGGDHPHESGVTGLEEVSVVNQAIGVLITWGYTPIEAHAELRRCAADTQHTVPDVARHLLLTSTNALPPHTGCPPPAPDVSTRAELLGQVIALQSKLATMPAIEQAKGALMATYGLTADTAFDMLRYHSQNRNVKIRDIAAELIILLNASPTNIEFIKRFDRLLPGATHAATTKRPYPPLPSAAGCW